MCLSRMIQRNHICRRGWPMDQKSLFPAGSWPKFGSGELRVQADRSRWLLMSVALSLLSGCVLGPHTVQPSSLGYNEVLHDTAESELLLNLVRARYGEQPMFVEVPSITQQYDFTRTATVSGHFGHHFFLPIDAFPHWLFGGTLAERPTIVLAPKFDEKFNQRLRAPITIDTMSILVWCGWNIDTVLRLASNNINGLDNALMAGRAHPEWPADVSEFRMVTQQLRQLQLQGKVELVAIFPETHEKNKKGDAQLASHSFSRQSLREAQNKPEEKRIEAQPHVLRFAPDVVGKPEHQNVTRLLRLREDKVFYSVKEAAEGILKEQAPYDDLILSRRSFSEVLFFLAQGIEVPCEHLVAGIAHQTMLANGEAFDWNTVTGDLIQVRCCPKRPGHAEVAVKYRDHWFYIEERDLASRYTLSLVTEIYNIEVRGGGGASVPLLTIGASGK